MAGLQLSADQRARLAEAPSVWLATVRPDGRAHLVPIWAILHSDDRLFMCTEARAQKVKNIQAQPSAVVSLPDPDQVLIVEGQATITPVSETPPEVLAAFQAKYDWDIENDSRYTMVVIVLHRVLAWDVQTEA